MANKLSNDGLKIDSKKKKAQRVQVSSQATNLRKQLQKDLNVRKVPVNYDEEALKKNKKERKKITVKSKSKKRAKPLDKVRKELYDLQEKAMARVKTLREKDLLKYSRAYQDALASKPNTGRKRRWLFDVKDTKSFKDIQREAGRIRAFLADDTSTVTGAEWAKAELKLDKYRGAFGNQWRDEYGEPYNMSIVENEYLRAAGKIYRYLEDLKGAYGLIYDEGGYDSESTFASIYDMVVEAGVTLNENGGWVDKTAEDNGLSIVFEVYDKLKHYKETFNKEAMKERSMGDVDSARLDNISKAQKYQDFLNKMLTI